jgi:hypothetical protein
MASNTSGATIPPPSRTGMTSRTDQHTNVYRSMSLAEVEERRAFVVDLTERKRAEQALHQAQAELAHLTRVMTMGELTASIVHEVNQPITGLAASACLRWLATPDPEQKRDPGTWPRCWNASIHPRHAALACDRTSGGIAECRDCDGVRSMGWLQPGCGDKCNELVWDLTVHFRPRVCGSNGSVAEIWAGHGEPEGPAVQGASWNSPARKLR